MSVTAHPRGMSHPAPPPLAFFSTLKVQVAPAHEVGQTPAGNRRIVAILGGDARGDGWTARVLPGGADFQAIVTPTLSRYPSSPIRKNSGDVGAGVYSALVRPLINFVLE